MMFKVGDLVKFEINNPNGSWCLESGARGIVVAHVFSETSVRVMWLAGIKDYKKSNSLITEKDYKKLSSGAGLIGCQYLKPF